MSEKKTQTASGYKRTLSNAHIQLIALGGTIGRWNNWDRPFSGGW